jgi:hypothetical protein
MHALWDSGMIQRAGNTEEFWLADLAKLDTVEARAATTKGTVEDWATESLLAAREGFRLLASPCPRVSGGRCPPELLSGRRELAVSRGRLERGSLRKLRLRLRSSCRARARSRQRPLAILLSSQSEESGLPLGEGSATETAERRRAFRP